MTMPTPERPTREAIHEHFGLSYAEYLVIPRTLLQSMPDDWQERFVGMLDDLEAAFAHVEQAPHYRVEAGEWVYTDPSEDDDPGGPTFLRTGEPVPHYNRGRTYVEPDLRAVEESRRVREELRTEGSRT
jgi:hypothetical protein